jgi:anti-sigma B factor antagonist
MTEPAPVCTLNISIEEKGEAVIVHLHGRLVSNVTGNFYSRVCQLIPNHQRIILNLADLTHMDSMGLGTLVRLMVSAKSKGCRLELLHLGTRIRELLGLTRLLDCFTIIGEKGVTLGF